MTSAETAVPNGGTGGYGSTETRVSVLESTIRNLATKADIAEVRADLYKLHSDFGKWIVATVITLAFAFLASTTGIISFLKSQQPTPQAQSTPQQQPIIINNVPPTPQRESNPATRR